MLIERPKVILARGDIFATMRHKDGSIERRVMHNVIVDVASELMAERMKENDGNASNGIMVLAVGTGDPGWDLQNPPVATSAQTQLINELERKTFNRSYYVDIGGSETPTRTNIVDFEVTYEETEAVGALVEMGLFGGAGSTAPNGGTMFNYHTFPVWNKPATSTLTIVWRLTF